MKNTPFARHRGFTLIELMVGLVVGLVTLFAVTQVYVNWEGRQRTAGSKNDAQISGTLAAYNLERDIRQAGAGFGAANSTEPTTPSKLGCEVTASINGAAVKDLDVNFLQFVPVKIIDDSPADKIIVFYGNSSFDSLTAIVSDSAEINKKSLKDRSGVMPGDKIILASADTPPVCHIVEVTAAASGTKTFEHLTAAYQSLYKPVGESTNPIMNSADGTIDGTGKAIGFDQAFNLGPEPKATEWSIGGSTSGRPVLLKTDHLPVAGVAPDPLGIAIAEGIVNLQAEYGYENSGSIVWSSTLPASIAWNNVLAIRYAVLARSRHYDPELLRLRALDLTDADNPVWAGGKFVMTDTNSISADSKPDGEDNWRGYRYVVYESVVSLRNVIWGRGL